MVTKQLIIALALFLSRCTTPSQPTYETDNTHFYNGEILLPDYVHTDTLVVTDAKTLNWCMANYDVASDGDINDILTITTKIK